MPRSQPQQRREQVEALKAEANTIRNLYRQAFESPAGRSVWKDLQEQFDGEVLHSTEHLQHVNVGSQRVIKHIRFMLEGD